MSNIDGNYYHLIILIFLNYEFHENHGRNIELEGKRVAKRVASYNKGVVISSKPHVKGKIFKILKIHKKKQMKKKDGFLGCCVV